MLCVVLLAAAVLPGVFVVLSWKRGNGFGRQCVVAIACLMPCRSTVDTGRELIVCERLRVLRRC